MNCPKCQTAMVQIIKPKAFSLAGILGALVFIIGAATLPFQPLAGLIIVLAGVIIGRFGRDKIDLLVCPNCKNRITL